MDEVRRISIPAAGAGALLRLLSCLAVVASPVRIRQANVALMRLLAVTLAPATLYHLVARALVVTIAQLSTRTIVCIRDPLLDAVLVAVALLPASRGRRRCDVVLGTGRVVEDRSCRW